MLRLIARVHGTHAPEVLGARRHVSVRIRQVVVVNGAVLVSCAVGVLKEPVCFRRVVHHDALTLQPFEGQLHVNVMLWYLLQPVHMKILILKECHDCVVFDHCLPDRCNISCITAADDVLVELLSLTHWQGRGLARQAVSGWATHMKQRVAFPAAFSRRQPSTLTASQFVWFRPCLSQTERATDQSSETKPCHHANK